MSEVDELAEPVDGGVEDLVEVERRGEVLGHLVEAEEELVGVGEAAHAVEGLGVAVVGIARDPPGVAGDDADEDELDAPLDRDAGVACSASRW